MSGRVATPLRLHRQLNEIWASGRGVKRLAAVNHSVIGTRFMITAFIFFGIGGLLAMLIRAQLATSRSAFIGPDLYNQLFTMHGTIMMFLFAIPMFEGMAIYLLPKLLGTRDLAFPRLGAFGYWCYLFGGAILIAAMLAGAAPDSGWFMYTPLSSSAFTPGINADVWLLGITFVEISAVTAAVELVVSILKIRAPGMSLSRMPIFGWYVLVTAGMMVLGFPPLILGSVLLELERAFDLPFFDTARGGDALLWQHLFWLFGHPEVYIIFLPAAGAISTILPVFARRKLIGYRAVVVALVALAFLSFGLWVHHMFAVGIPHMALAFFSAASAAVTVPTAVQIFAWIATLAHGRPRFDIPMLWIFGFLFVFILGGLTGVMLAMVPFNWQAHDTQFVTAHLHYVLVGGFIFPLVAALYYWLPHICGRIPAFRLSMPAFWLVFIGFNVTFFMMHLTGLRGMPRRVDTYPVEAGWDWLNLTSSIGGFILTMGFALIIVDVFLQIRYGRRFRRNPWKARTLEWAQPIPPPAYNFLSLPWIERRADTLEPESIGPQLAAGHGYLGFARNGWMETLGVDITSGRTDHVIVLPRQTYLPLWTALAVATFVLSLLFSYYWFSLLPLGVAFMLLLCWTRVTGLDRDNGPVVIGREEVAPLHYETHRPPSWWGMIITLIADAAFYGSLVFSPLFLWLTAPAWPPPQTLKSGLVVPALLVAALAAAPLCARRAVARNARSRSPVLWLGATAVLQFASLILLVILMRTSLPAPTAHAYNATSFALLAYSALHTFLATVFCLFGLRRVLTGYVSARRSLDLRIATPLHDYTAITGFAGIGLVLLLPALITAGEAFR
ncbi:cytochrome c oxidase, subunit I [Nitrobacter winogradskyi Nb-255]|uniref:cytochrome-c oxidase n=1 Tax=Nitrobacter winogradskyi (strain ATCC 25391 / DSM 10237 / CIP 104748 / NCIMB 11846 / Nb-255) TaxID=323098 RepID=Q3SQ73_NITWN|nr:cytochrome c oxidase subunit I [Nitrobacter winogradskyi]ABA05568.1 cytochrome c oxidase, subunit I [Nitrobacter winogradskyi Nb-255]